MHVYVTVSVSADVSVCTQCRIYCMCGLQSLDWQFAQSEMISLPFLTAKVFSLTVS